MIIVFFYRIADRLYHGKYIGYVSYDYEEGLDIELRALCFPIWKHTHGIKDPEEVCVGIISHYRDGHDYFSENEKHIFDLLYCNWSNQPVEVFVNGTLIPKIDLSRAISD